MTGSFDSYDAKLMYDAKGVGNWAETVVVGPDVEISIALEANRQ